MPRIIQLVFIIVALIYLVFPRDLVPDFLGLLGIVDDVVLLFLLYRYYRSLKSKLERASKIHNSSEQTGQHSSGQRQHSDNQGSSVRDPYTVLELSPDASADEIDRQYKRLVARYHPDKVNHLGKELQDLAHKKMLEIQDAYEALKKQ